MHQYPKLEVWRRSLALAAALQKTGRASRLFVDRAAWSQIVRAALSVPANISEGSMRGTPREFAQYLSVAIGSCAELHTLLLVARETRLLEVDAASHACEEAVALRKMLVGLRARVQGLPRSRARVNAPPPSHP